MNKKLKAIAQAVAVSSAFTVVGVCAADYQKSSKVRPTYNYAGVKLTSQSLDDYDCRQNGAKVDGSLDLNGQVFFRGAFSDVSGDGCGSTAVNASVGYRAGWGETSHIYGLVGVDQVSPDHGSGDSGLLLGGGIRGYIAPNIEGYFEVDYSTLGEGDVSLNLGSAFWVNANFAVTVEAGVSADQNNFAVGGRLAF